MAIDEKVAFYLRHRTLIEEWAALRGQAAAALEEAFTRAVGIVGQRPDAPEIVKDDADRRYPCIASASRFRALHPARCGSRWAGRAGAAEAIGRDMAVYGHQGPRRR